MPRRTCQMRCMVVTVFGDEARAGLNRGRCSGLFAQDASTEAFLEEHSNSSTAAARSMIIARRLLKRFHGESSAVQPDTAGRTMHPVLLCRRARKILLLASRASITRRWVN